MRHTHRAVFKQVFLLLGSSALAFSQSSHSVTLNWGWQQNGGGVGTGFNVKRGTVSGGPYSVVGTVSSPSAVTYTDFGPFIEGNTYYYVVTAVGPGGESAPSNEASATIPTTSAVLTSSVNPSTVGQPVTFTASFSAAAQGPGSTIQFFDGSILLGSTPVIGGQASFTTSSLTAGSHAIIAENGSVVLASRGQVVQGMPSTATVTADPPNILYGQAVVLTTQIGPSPPAGFAGPTGQVVFQDNGYPIGMALVSAGKATLALNTLATGTHVVTAVYSGDILWASCFARVTVAVAQPDLRMDNAAAMTLSSSVAPDETVDMFNVTLLKTDTQATSLPLPNALPGVLVSIKDSNGVTRLAQLYGAFASTSQVRFVVPGDTAPGQATVTVTGVAGVALSAQMTITPTAPGIFTANSNGQGVYAGQVVHVHADGSQTSESSALFDLIQNSYVPNPIDMGPPDDQVFLVLYGTGIRHRLSDAEVTATILGMNIPTESAAQETYPGLDQVNLQLPRELEGAGIVNIVVTVEGQEANPVAVAIQ